MSLVVTWLIRDVAEGSLAAAAWFGGICGV